MSSCVSFLPELSLKMALCDHTASLPLGFALESIKYLTNFAQVTFLIKIVIQPSIFFFISSFIKQTVVVSYFLRIIFNVIVIIDLISSYFSAFHLIQKDVFCHLLIILRSLVTLDIFRISVSSLYEELFSFVLIFTLSLMSFTFLE